MSQGSDKSYLGECGRSPFGFRSVNYFGLDGQDEATGATIAGMGMGRQEAVDSWVRQFFN